MSISAPRAEALLARRVAGSDVRPCTISVNQKTERPDHGPRLDEAGMEVVRDLEIGRMEGEREGGRDEKRREGGSMARG